MILLAFLILSAACCGYAAIRGGSPDRPTGAIFVTRNLAPGLLSFRRPPPGLSQAIFVVDTVMRFALGSIMLLARRYWPIAITAFQLLAVIGHLIRLLDPQIVPVLYWVANAFWAVPQMIVLAVATRRHQARLSRFGTDPSWTRPGMANRLR